MPKDKHISTTVSETPFTKTTTTIKQRNECFCYGAWEVRALATPYNYSRPSKPEVKQVTKQPITHQNCPCETKFTAFKKKHKEEFKDLKDHAVLQKFLEIEFFGPCTACKGTGSQFYAHRSALAKYLCVNGPYIGQRITTVDMYELEEEYCLFNNAGHHAPEGYNAKHLKAIWVHEGSLKD
jgi:hypothetical protein